MPGLSQIIAYLRYLLLHKWLVFKKCVSRGQIWRGIMHDCTKLLPDEFFPYVRYFHGKNQYKSTNSENPEQEGPPRSAEFEYAWLRHQNRNDHHWQWWVCITSAGQHVAIPMSRAAVIEMVCDWYGAGVAQGKPDVKGWYEENKDDMMLHPETRRLVEEELTHLVD